MPPMASSDGWSKRDRAMDAAEAAAAPLPHGTRGILYEELRNQNRLLSASYGDLVSEHEALCDQHAKLRTLLASVSSGVQGLSLEVQAAASMREPAVAPCLDPGAPADRGDRALQDYNERLQELTKMLSQVNLDMRRDSHLLKSELEARRAE